MPWASSMTTARWKTCLRTSAMKRRRLAWMPSSPPIPPKRWPFTWPCSSSSAPAAGPAFPSSSRKTPGCSSRHLRLELLRSPRVPSRLGFVKTPGSAFQRSLASLSYAAARDSRTADASRQGLQVRNNVAHLHLGEQRSHLRHGAGGFGAAGDVGLGHRIHNGGGGQAQHNLSVRLLGEQAGD